MLEALGEPDEPEPLLNHDFMKGEAASHSTRNRRGGVLGGRASGEIRSTQIFPNCNTKEQDNVSIPTFRIDAPTMSADGVRGHG